SVSWRAGCRANWHVRFGGRSEETGWSKGQYRASGRPYWGEGPRIAGRRTWLFCAWLSWSRFRVVIPVWDCTLGTLVACLDTTL
ncbi:hypothetical protein R6M67_49495, partial [Streptomyces sp. Wh19]|nr:hypothetical protein [Streptomyces sp. Wh19]